MHWILKVTRVEDAYVVLEGDAGEFVLPRPDLPAGLSEGDTVKLEHIVRRGRAGLGCTVLGGRIGQTA